MPDYTSILRRSIAALPDPDADMRETVYQRARAALARQLTAVEPPLSTEEIEAQHQELEHAVDLLEAEYAADTTDADLATVSRDDFAEVPQARHAEPVGPEASAPGYDTPDSGDGDYDDEDESDFDSESGRSRLPLLIAALLVFLVIAGIGALAYTQRDFIAGLFGGSAAEEEVALQEAPTAEPAEAPDAGESAAPPAKIEDRLGNGEAPAADAPDAGAEPAPEPPTTLPADDETPAAPLAPESATPTGEQQTAAADQPEQNIVSQRAIYYFQGAEGSPGRAVEGSVTWAQITREGQPAIQSTLRFPDQDVTTTVTIYRNLDSSLPASHLVEIQFSAQFGTSVIQRVPALVLKQTEQARGQPLAGAAVPVTDELFWIALSDDSEQASRNVQLLREGSWFDVPILFADGTRALLTFEKGIPGDRVFESVMAGWSPS